MREEKQVKPGSKPAKNAERRARLGVALRGNLLKRKAQARAKEAPPKDRDEGRQS
jgi:hypothetical protein